ncbi:MAG: hypothetical protein M3P91_09550 [Actinomycetota bacterium]|nr:hypothetical protein [Actinomycetota bacterium]
MSTAPLHARTPQGRPWSRPPLRVVTAPRPRPARAPFVGLLLGMLALGLLLLLLLNTALAQDSVKLYDLQQQHAVVLDRAEELESEILAGSAPNELAKRASALGMVPLGTPVFLHLPDGRVTGAATPAAPGLPPADATAGAGSLPGTYLGVTGVRSPDEKPQDSAEDGR